MEDDMPLVDPRNDDDYDTWAYGTEPLPGDIAWLHPQRTAPSLRPESGPTSE